ncbi:hypothetical protein [Spiroplasma endosymbiont of Polydrusus cervinus]|uniref:hypothetical protein n=1 Tax=Spiroplasma endosymbiont of Polydrusus cervinus TaxID=3066287 RepID=UPI0030D313BD
MDKNKECSCSNCDICKINLEFEQEKEKIINKYSNELDQNFCNYKEIEECKKIINDSIRDTILRYCENKYDDTKLNKAYEKIKELEKKINELVNKEIEQLEIIRKEKINNLNN